MCGFTFIYRQGSTKAELIKKSRHALDLLSHRGPDDEGLWCDPPVAVGHRRLAIIDLEASRQPMADPSGRFVLAYNGEVYNFKELRQGLKSNWRFRTNGDTEVVLAGLALKGDAFLSKMEGMWALALWDNVDHSLLLSRDRMGKKPLFYQTTTNVFACASELPALARIACGPWEEDLDSTADYLRYGYFLPGTTAFKDVHEVLPGHITRWSPQEGLTHNRYWTLTIGGFTGSRKQAAMQLRERLIRAVDRRMVADVGVGAFLSGGIDSSLITAIMVNELGLNPETFTIGFQEEAFDERPFARLMANRLNTRHHEQCLDSWDRELLTRLILDHVGQPFFDSSLLPTALVSRLTAQHLKVALSGDGGDELFSGYQRYQARSLLRWYTRLPGPLRKDIEQLLRMIPEPMVHHSRSLLKKAHLFLDVAERQQNETPYIAPVLYSRKAFDRLAPGLAERGHAAPGLPEEAHADGLMEMMAADALVYLPQDILVKVDRASMAYSLETRAPFLDREVVELAFSLPRHWHRRWFRGKRMLRTVFDEFLPADVWKRRKQGFGVPIHKWFRGELGDELSRLVSRQKDSPLEKQPVQAMLDLHRNGARDHGHRLWGIYVYLLWKERRPCPGY